VQSQNKILQFVRVNAARLLVAGVKVCVSGGSVNAIGLGVGSGGHIIVPSSIFFPSLAATLTVTQLGGCAIEKTQRTSVTIPRHVRIVCSECFSGYIGCATLNVTHANLTIKINFNILRSFSSSDILAIYLHTFCNRSIHSRKLRSIYPAGFPPE
jgi:hypothetical protein